VCSKFVVLEVYSLQVALCLTYSTYTVTWQSHMSNKGQ